jgi:hypothetical protein
LLGKGGGIAAVATGMSPWDGVATAVDAGAASGFAAGAALVVAGTAVIAFDAPGCGEFLGTVG